jgi:hypothetical protein
MNFFRLATVGAAVMLVGGALPSVAGATDYCVAPNQSCGANNLQYLQPALDLAASTAEADRVFLGEGTYVGHATKGFFYSGWNSPVEIVGAGRGQTILTSPEFGIDRVLWLGGADGSSVHDLTIRIPPKAAQSFRGLLMTTGTARRIEVVQAAVQQSHHVGAELSEDSVLEDSTVTLDSAQDTTGVSLADTIPGGAPSVLRGSVVRAATGVDVYHGGTIERSRVIGENRAVVVAGGSATVSDSLLTITGTFGTVLRAVTEPGLDTNVTADGLTVFASPNLPDTGGVAVSTAPDPDRNVHLALTNSIVRGATPLAAIAGGAGTGTISAEYSDYDAGGNIAWGGSINESHVSNVGDAGFDEQTGHEYSLLPTSPLLDKGDPDAPQGLDLNGNPRIADGNGDGYARHDLGAFELQPAAAPAPPQGTGLAADTQAPLISGFRSTRSVFAVAAASTPRAARVARGTRLRYTLSENARVALKIQRRLAGRSARYRTVGTLTRNGLIGVNRIRFTGRIGRRALRPGRYRAVITATDAAANRSAPKAASFRVTR